MIAEFQSQESWKRSNAEFPCNSFKILMKANNSLRKIYNKKKKERKIYTYKTLCINFEVDRPLEIPQWVLD